MLFLRHFYIFFQGKIGSRYILECISQPNSMFLNSEKNTYGYPEQLSRGSESSQKVVFHQKNALFIIFLGPICGSLIQYNHISYIISCADANKKRFKYRTLFSPLRGSGALVIVLKTLSILFKDNLNFLFFFLICKKMLSDVNYTIAFVSH